MDNLHKYLKSTEITGPQSYWIQLMSTRREKCLATRAHQQISICCETLCEKEVVEEYIKELENKIVELEQKIKQLSEDSR